MNIFLHKSYIYMHVYMYIYNQLGLRPNNKYSLSKPFCLYEYNLPPHPLPPSSFLTVSVQNIYQIKNV